jgi:hypothetical protein
MPWKIYPNGSRELVRPTKYEKHQMLYTSVGVPARALSSLEPFPVQTVFVTTVEKMSSAHRISAKRALPKTSSTEEA